MVSIVVVTFNHEKFISICLDSILAQQTDFSFEIIIGEDDSSDNTRAICQDYAENHPDQIRLFLRDRAEVKVLFGKQIGMNNFKKTLKAATGKYIAICEGDDYWNDPYKLQKQVDWLEIQQDYAGCFHDASTVDKLGQVIASQYYSPTRSSYDESACLTELRSAYATCTLMFRSTVIKEPWPKWFVERTCDEFLDLMITKQGLLGYITDIVPAAYRLHDGGVWRGSSELWRLKDMFFRRYLLLQDSHFSVHYKEILDSTFLILGFEIINHPNSGSDLSLIREKMASIDKDYEITLFTLLKKHKIGLSLVAQHVMGLSYEERIGLEKVYSKYIQDHININKIYLKELQTTLGKEKTQDLLDYEQNYSGNKRTLEYLKNVCSTMHFDKESSRKIRKIILAKQQAYSAASHRFREAQLEFLSPEQMITFDKINKGAIIQPSES